MPVMRPLGTTVRRALTPSPRPAALLPAVRTVVAVLACAVLGAVLGDSAALGMMYFGAACAAVFVTAGVYRARALALAAQGIGAAAGLGLGALAGALSGKIVVAAAVAFVCGVVGAIGPLFTAGAVMAVIGVAYGQFSGVGMPWWQQALWYLLGTAVVAVPALLPWPVRGRALERQAVAAVFGASAALLDAVGTEDAARRRVELAARSAAAEASVLGYRLSAPRRRRELVVELAAARRAALDAAAHYVTGSAPPTDAARELRAAERRLRAGLPSRAPAGDPVAAASWRRSATATARRLGSRALLLAGARLAWCMALATLAAGALHHAGHSYWLPLTVAVVVRTEYGSVFVRTLNRIVGTLGGAVVAAVALLCLHSGWPLVPVAALAIGFAVLAAPKLYALSVVGVTASALLSACFATADVVLPVVRLGDTAIGCAIALVFGYLLWPGRRSLPGEVHLAATARAAVGYLRRVAEPDGDARELGAARDEAYRAAHESRAAAVAVAADPSPLSGSAESALPAAVALEDAVDGISALDAALQQARPALTPRELDQIEGSIVACLQPEAARGGPTRIGSAHTHTRTRTRARAARVDVARLAPAPTASPAEVIRGLLAGSAS